MSSEISEGDRVQVVGGTPSPHTGRVGTVVSIDTDWFDRNRVWLRFSPMGPTQGFLAAHVHKLSLLELLAEAASE